ncbi:MAG: class I SAM-dependent methyltransferase [Galactobacter sp.]
MSDTPDTSHYAHGHHSSVLASHALRGIKDSAPHLTPLLRANMNILDLGSGPGSITLELAKAVGPDGHVTGLDFSAEAVRTASAAAEERGTSNVDFRVADVYSLHPGSDGLQSGYEVVHAHQVLQHLPDPVQAIRVAASLVSPGGILSLREVDYSATTWSPPSVGLDTWLRVLRRYMSLEGHDADAGGKMATWLDEAGIPASAVRLTQSEQTYTTPEARKAWGESWVQRALHSAFRDLSIKHGLLDQAGVEAVAQAWQHFADAPSGNFTFLHTEALVRF